MKGWRIEVEILFCLPLRQKRLQWIAATNIHQSYLVHSPKRKTIKLKKWQAELVEAGTINKGVFFII
jgi:hypothetical protein